MSEVTGVIDRIYENERNTRYGKKMTFTINVNGENYGCGFDPLPKGAVEGATVSFSTSVNGNYTNADAKTMQIVKGAEDAPSGTSTKSTGKAASSPRGGHDDPRQRVIVYQSARNAATETLRVMLEHDCFSLPTKKADKYDAFMAMHAQLTDRYHLDAMAVYTGAMVITEELLNAEAPDDNGFDD